MTIVAAYENDNMPILIGDLVLSSGGERTSNLKKIIKLSNNCVVGWTGNRKTAEDIFRRLRHYLRSGGHTFENLKKFFTAFREMEYGSYFFGVQIVGWLVEAGEPICFWWMTACPTEFYPEKSPIILGEDTDVLMNKDSVLALNGLWTEREFIKPYSRALTAVGLIGNAMQREYLQFNSTNSATYGFAYEILFYNGRYFQYLTGITYHMFLLDVNVDVDPPQIPDNIIKLLHPRIRVNSDSDITQVTKLAHAGSRASITFIKGPGVVGDEQRRLDRLTHHRLSKIKKSVIKNTSNFYCTVFVIRDCIRGTRIGACIKAEHRDSPEDERTLNFVDSETCRTALPIDRIFEMIQNYKLKINFSR